MGHLWTGQTPPVNRDVTPSPKTADKIICVLSGLLILAAFYISLFCF